jgi:hypothetical protein
MATSNDPEYTDFNSCILMGDEPAQNFAEEFLTVLELMTGMYSMAVNTDWTDSPTRPTDIRSGPGPIR